MTPDVNLYHHLFKTTLQRQFFYWLHLPRKTQISLNLGTFLVAIIILQSTVNYHHLDVFSDIYTNKKSRENDENLQNDLLWQNCLQMLQSVKPCPRFALALLLKC